MHAFHGIRIPFRQICRTTPVREKAREEMHGRVFSLIYLIAGVGGGVCGAIGVAFGQLRQSK